jgi:hypothetical protein
VATSFREAVNELTLEHLSLLGTAISTKEFLAILTLIRDIP